MTSKFRNNLTQWLGLAGVVIFGVLMFANQVMPFWFNVIFIVGCLVLLAMLPKAKKHTQSEDPRDTTPGDTGAR